jgi:membrane protein involved in colicin uptake
MYQAEQQKKAAEDAERKREQAAAAAKAEADMIASETKPEEEAADGVKFGSGDGELDKYEDFLVPKNTSSAGLTASNGGLSGLGFKV